MIPSPDDPPMTLPEALEDRARLFKALELIAEAAEATKDRIEVVRHIGMVARRAIAVSGG